MTDIVERLRELERVERELAHDGDCPPEATANWRYAETCKSAANEIKRLRAALREIDQQRYTGRNTINPDNAYEMAVAINAKLLAVMDIARTALKEDGDE